MQLKQSAILLSALTLGACGGSGGNAPPPVANAAPQLAAIGKQTLTANGPGTPIALNLSDDRTAVGALSLSVSSSNISLVPDAGVVLGTAGALRQLTITPLPDEFGVTTISVSATDSEGLSTTRSFDVTVAPQSLSLLGFARDELGLAVDDGVPLPINAVEFVQDADEDAFDDLFDL